LNSALAVLAETLDRIVWGGAIQFLALLGRYTGLVSRETDEHTLNGGFDAASKRLRRTGVAYSQAQKGDARGYLRTLALGFVILVLLVVLGGVR
jgi:NADH-quinone oxidoreductase subunit L